jgi:hypothetical protein
MNSLAAIGHPSFQKPAQMLERLRDGPALHRRRLVQRSGLLFEQRQVMSGLEHELATLVAARMAGDLEGAAEDRHPIDEPLRQNVAKAIGGGNGIVVQSVTHERQRGDLRRAFMTRVEGRGGPIAQDRLIRGKPFADRLLMGRSL